MNNQLYMIGNKIVFINNGGTNVDVIEDDLDVESIGGNWYMLDFDIECIPIYENYGVSLTNAYIISRHRYCRVMKYKGNYYINTRYIHKEWSLEYTKKYYRGYKDSDYWNRLMKNLTDYA